MLSLILINEQIYNDLKVYLDLSWFMGRRVFSDKLCQNERGCPIIDVGDYFACAAFVWCIYCGKQLLAADVNAGGWTR